MMQNLPHTHLGREIVADPTLALEHEWLVSNGIGGFASASLAGANTRRYHGLLVAALQPPLDRTVLLGKLEEQISLAGNTYSLDVNEWRGGAVSLHGLTHLQRVDFEGTLPTFHYKLDQADFSKTIWLEHGLNTTYVRYTYNAKANDNPIELQVRALVNGRDYHELTQGSLNWHFLTEANGPDSWQIRAGEEAQQWGLYTFDRPVQWRAEYESGWYWGYFYRQEEARGLAAAEDMYCMGTFVTSLAPGQSVTFVASTHPAEIVRKLYPNAYERETARQTALLGRNPKIAEQAFSARLALAADQFIVGRPDPDQPGTLQPDYRTVLAGYHWFSDWGRDTMISLPGLTLVTGRFEEAATILRSFAQFVDRGMLPNRFPDSTPLGEGDYNTVDATVWYFDAVDKYLDATGDTELGRELYPVLSDIVRWHVNGTRFGIGVDKDGLLKSGEPGVQLTWMDVKIGDWVVTPRHGKPIEISALWYRACRIMEKLAQTYGTGEGVRHFHAMAEQVAAIFERVYWYAEGGYFYDNIDLAGRPDPSLRPNQVIALAVAPELVSNEKRALALAKVQEKLLTPYGLRTLSPDHPDYQPYYIGGREQRDAAYHQGTVWPWLLGPYARLLTGKAALDNLLKPFVDNINEASVGQLNEVYGAERPFPPVGCVAQAWSISSVLEIWQALQDK